MSRIVLPARSLPRAQRSIAPVIWELPDRLEAAHRAILPHLASAGANWFVVPRQLPLATLAEVASALNALALNALADGAHLIIAVDATQLQPRRSRIVQDRLAPFARSRCQAVLLQDASPGDIKAGNPFHRLSQWRDQGITDLFFIEVPDHETAEWMLNHTPAHAVGLPFGLADQTAKYRLLDDAQAFGTGLIARPPRQIVWPSEPSIDPNSNIAFILAEPALSAIILPLPSTLHDLDDVIQAASHPMSDSDRQAWWHRFTQQVPPPAPPPRGTPPE